MTIKNKKILVTGDTGFKGSWLCAWLTLLGADVVGLALEPTHPNGIFNRIQLADRIRHHTVDIRDLNAVVTVFQQTQPDMVFHLAAQPLVRLSYQDPKTTFDTNIGGSVNILEAVRHIPSVRALVYITSDKCYANKEWVWGYRENDELGGFDPYSASKAAAEIVFLSYLRSFFSDRAEFGAASVRAGNVIGGGDWSADRIIPDCMRALLDQKPIVIRNPGATRPWQHVLEPLSGYIQLAGRLLEDPNRFSGSWNFGPSPASCATVRQLVDMVVREWTSGEVQLQSDSDLHEAGLLQLNCDKAHHLLNWYPTWTIHQTVTETVSWYRHWAAGDDMMAFTQSQISRYMEDRA